jgi:hypothetical protein
MKSLFNENDFTYTKEASDLYREACKIVNPLVKKWMEMGYNPREIETITIDALSMEVAFQHAYLALKVRGE